MNIFRNEYRSLNPDEILCIKSMKEKAERLYDDLCGASVTDQANRIALAVAREEGMFYVQADARMLALARTKLEESIMWATKAVTG